MKRLSGRFVTVVPALAIAVSTVGAGVSFGADKPAGQRQKSGAPPAGVPPAVVTITESIAVVDTPAALPPAVIDIRESVGVADQPGGAPPPTEEPTRRKP
jgi:hypothetical protein